MRAFVIIASVLIMSILFLTAIGSGSTEVRLINYTNLSYVNYNYISSSAEAKVYKKLGIVVRVR